MTKTLIKRKICEGCGRDMYRKWLGASYGKKLLCMSCNAAGVRFTATGEVCKPETEEDIFKRNIPIAEEIAARLIREERERKQEFMTGFSPEDAVHWVHIDRKDEPDNKVHLMIGEEEQNINLTECGSDAGLNPKEASLNSVTAGDLCAECLANYVRQCGYHVRYA